MARPANGESSWRRRWLLFMRAVVDRAHHIEIKDVELVPLPEWSVWLGDFVEETGVQPLADAMFEVTEDVAVMSAEPSAGLSVPELGLYYIDGRWKVTG